MSKDFVSKPCKNCPFRTDVKPFLHPHRAEELAFNAENPWGIFYCHETLEDGDYDEGGNRVGMRSKVCAGHLTLQAACNGPTAYDADGFEPGDGCYCEPWEMIAAYEEAWGQ